MDVNGRYMSAVVDAMMCCDNNSSMTELYSRITPVGREIFFFAFQILKKIASNQKTIKKQFSVFRIQKYFNCQN
jgi:plasmid replication initiation protein